jgi:hypothetical protein
MSLPHGGHSTVHNLRPYFPMSFNIFGVDCWKDVAIFTFRPLISMGYSRFTMFFTNPHKKLSRGAS